MISRPVESPRRSAVTAADSSASPSGSPTSLRVTLLMPPLTHISTGGHGGSHIFGLEASTLQSFGWVPDGADGEDLAKDAWPASTCDSPPTASGSPRLLSGPKQQRPRM